MKQGSDRIDYRETADITEVHAAVQREKPEPFADVTPMPLWLTGVCAGAMVWAGTYFGIFHGGLSANVYNEYESSPAVLFPQPTKAGAKAGAAEAPQSLADMGKGVYANCASCHQPGGTGVAGQFPPLAKSEWVMGSEKRLVAILLKGVQGPITVLGAKGTYSGNMVPWEGTLSDKKIAAVASYVRAQWGNAAPEISAAKVAAARKEFAAQKAQWTEAELLQIPADATLPDEAGAAAPTAPTPAPTKAGTSATATSTAATPEQLAEGKKHYMMTCTACHMPTGAGLPGMFPPLTKSPYVSGSPERLAAIILKGNTGPFTVDGKPFGLAPMPSQESALTDDKIAAIMTFVRANFGNTGGPVTPEVVAGARQKFADRKTSWTQAELDAWKDDAPADGAK